MEESIGIKRATKRQLAQEKPDMLSWDAYLRALQESVDPKVLQKNIEKLLDQLERMAYDQAIARVQDIRARKAAGRAGGYSAAEAKERVRMHRLAKRSDELSQLLRAGASTEELAAVARNLDQELHELLPVA